MNDTIEFTVWVSLFDVIMIGLILVGAYRGFTQGVIVQTISLFSVLIGLTICVNVSKQVYNMLDSISLINDLLAMFVLVVLFCGVIYLTLQLNRKVSNHIAGINKGFTNRALGAVFGAVKYFFIAAVFLIAMFKLDEHVAFLPKSAKSSRLTYLSTSLVTSIFPYLKMDNDKLTPFKRPDDANN
ncbi:MAG: CvpA family protein [Bacteroidales bacterium]|nr:CvpA family protein [Bacteroidales bacterium]